MIEEAKAPLTPPGLDKRVLFAPHRIALITMWLLATVSFAVMLLSGVRNTGEFLVEANIFQVAYVLALLWYLIRTGPSVKQLPDLRPLLLPRLRIGKRIPVLVLALLLVVEFFAPGITKLLLMLATIWILIAWRREIGLPAVLLGLAVTTIALFAGLGFYQNQYIQQVFFIAELVLAC